MAGTQPTKSLLLQTLTVADLMAVSINLLVLIKMECEIPSYSTFKPFELGISNDDFPETLPTFPAVRTPHPSHVGGHPPVAVLSPWRQWTTAHHRPSIQAQLHISYKDRIG